MSRRAKYTLEELIDAVSKSSSMRMLLFSLGLKEAGGSHSNMKQKLERLNIDTSHWTGQGWNKGLKDPCKRQTKASDYLIQGSSVRSAFLKEKCVSEGLLDNVCYECGLCPEWEGNPLVLHLDHINGDKYDNRLENLRILCPNCHSQTDTFCGKNKGSYEEVSDVSEE